MFSCTQVYASAYTEPIERNERKTASPFTTDRPKEVTTRARYHDGGERIGLPVWLALVGVELRCRERRSRLRLIPLGPPSTLDTDSIHTQTIVTIPQTCN